MSGVMVLFFKGKGTVMDSLIRWWTNSKYSHCEILFDNGLIFSADAWNSKAVRYTSKFTLDNWDVISIPLNEATVNYIKMWCDDRVGMKYDWTGVLRFVLPILPQIETRWFCSELCGAALKYAGVLSREVDVHGLSPQGLYMQLLKLQAKSPLK